MGGTAAVAPSIHVYPAPLELKGLVESIWTFSAGSARCGRLVDYVEPDISAELIWRLGDQPKLFLRGPQSGFSTIALDAPSNYIGARLLPGTATRLFRVAAATIRDNRIPIRIVDPATRARPQPVHRRGVPLSEARTSFATLLASAWQTTSAATLARMPHNSSKRRMAASPLKSSPAGCNARRVICTAAWSPRSASRRRRPLASPGSGAP
jgi:hypothetical protein